MSNIKEPEDSWDDDFVDMKTNETQQNEEESINHLNCSSESYSSSSQFEKRIECQIEYDDSNQLCRVENIVSIPPSIYNYEISKLILDYNKIEGIPTEFCSRLRSLTLLSLRGCGLNSLPPNFHELSNLESLDLTENKLKCFPKSICSLTKLKKLILKIANQVMIPPEIGALAELEILSLEENEIKYLPEDFGNLVSLTCLELNNNILCALPNSFGSLISLSVLNLSYNQIKVLPSSFGDLPSLEKLELSDNHLTSLPEIFSSKRLQKLYLDNNDLTFLPPWFGDLPELEELTLKCNCLRDKQFPDHFGEISKKLTKLDLSGNLLNELPATLGKISALTFIDMGSALFEPERNKILRNGNNLTHLPFDFGLNLEHIVELRFDENQIEDLPECFGDGMPNLGILDLYCNCLVTLPDSFCKLSKLRFLTIGMNCLKRLPQDFGNLGELEELRLEKNQLTSLPGSFDKLSNLRILDLFENCFDYIPSILRHLTNLKNLDLGSNVTSTILHFEGNEKDLINRLKKAMAKGVPRRQSLPSRRIGENWSLNNFSPPSSPNHDSGYNSFTENSTQATFYDHDAEENWEQFNPNKPYEHEPLCRVEVNGFCQPIDTREIGFRNFYPKRIKVDVGEFEIEEHQYSDASEEEKF